MLFGPIGAPAQSFGWTAHVTDAAVPPATLQVLPVVPSRHPELKTGEDGYHEGATTGAELTLVDAFIRYVGFILSCIVIFIGVIWVAFDANKQGWHDKIAGTYVVKA